MASPGGATCLIAQDFLQTVVIVDDQADLGLSNTGTPASAPALSNAVRGATGEAVGVVDKDVRGSGTAEGADDIDADPDPDLVEPSDDALSVAEHGFLDAKTIINDFAQIGLVCGVIRPEQNEDIGPIVSAAATRADVLVLDWWMHGDAGATSKAIIKQLARSGDQQDRIRLIVIYTGAQDLRGVASEVAGCLDGAEVIGEHLTRVDAGSIRLVVLAKPDTPVDPGLIEDVVSFEAFPARVVKEFARTVEGLLSNVALAALAAVRANTHRILNRFDRVLDPAFLGHRMLLPDPEDAEQHLVEMILQEFSAVLEKASVGNNANYKAVQQLVSDAVLVINDIERLSAFASRRDVPISDVAMGFVKEGVDRPEFMLSNKERKDIRGWASRIFAFASGESGSTSSEVSKEWSMLMSNKLQYGDRPPIVRLGTIVRDADRGAFMLCMQPVCDSVRLLGRTSFPFLPLDEVTDGPDIVVKYSDQYYLLSVRKKFYDIIMIPFEPSDDTSRTVKAIHPSESKGWQFVSAPEGASFEWVAELRDNFAYKFANRFAESASRVGTDDSELFRRTAS
jgi:hypothetical protein